VFARHGDNWLGRLQMQIRAELAVLFVHTLPRPAHS
jgi:hypothetical protein